MKKTAFISDIIFTFFFTAFAALFLFRYLGLRLWLALLLCALCGALAAFVVGSILHLRRKTTFLKKSDEALKQKLLLHLALLSDKEKTEFFRVRLEERPLHKFSSLKIYGEENFYFIHFKFTPVTADEIAALSRLKTDRQKILLCAEIDENASRLCQRLNVQIWTGERVYERLKNSERLPENYLGGENADAKAERRKRLWFSKRNAKRFLISAALVLFSSFLTPFTYYYLIFAGVLLLSALFVRIFGYE